MKISCPGAFLAFLAACSYAPSSAFTPLALQQGHQQVAATVSGTYSVQDKQSVQRRRQTSLFLPLLMIYMYEDHDHRIFQEKFQTLIM